MRPELHFGKVTGCNEEKELAVENIWRQEGPLESSAVF